MGLEPTNGGTTIHCLNHLATLAIRFLILSSNLRVDPLSPWADNGTLCVEGEVIN